MIRRSIVLMLCLFGLLIQAQTNPDSTKTSSSKISKVVKNDGTVFVGKILSQDAREVLIDTKEIGQVAIPKHEIKEIRELKIGEISVDGKYIPSEVFSTRYFITTNGLPIEKGESYIQWNLFGPDFQFGVGKNFGMGIMTSWLGFPIIGSAKYSINLGEDINIGIGTLLGTGSWAMPDFLIALPFTALTFGDRRANINFSGGYGAVVTRSGLEGRALCSVAGMVKVGRKISLVFDSFIILQGPAKQVSNTGFNSSNSATYTYYTTTRSPGMALIIPGLRWQMEPNKAFQFGFTGIIYDSNVLPLPIPMVQWYRKL